MIILADTNQKPGYHPEEDTLMEHGHDLVRLKLPVGDYCVMTDRFMDMYNNRRHEVYTDNTFFNGRKKVRLQPQDALGTYTVSVDVKLSCRELAGNLLNSRYGNRYRFDRELLRAKHLGVKLWIVVADDNIHNREELKHYKQYRRGEEIGQAMMDKMEMLKNEYGCSFLFTTKQELPNVIEQILSQERLPWAS